MTSRNRHQMFTLPNIFYHYTTGILLYLLWPLYYIQITVAKCYPYPNLFHECKSLIYYFIKKILCFRDSFRTLDVNRPRITDSPNTHSVSSLYFGYFLSFLWFLLILSFLHLFFFYTCRYILYSFYFKLCAPKKGMKNTKKPTSGSKLHQNDIPRNSFAQFFYKNKIITRSIY